MMIARDRHIKWKFSPENVLARISNKLYFKVFNIAKQLELCRKCAKRIDFDQLSSSPELPLHYERFLAWEREVMCLSCAREREENLKRSSWY